MNDDMTHDKGREAVRSIGTPDEVFSTVQGTVRTSGGEELRTDDVFRGPDSKLYASEDAPPRPPRNFRAEIGRRISVRRRELGLTQSLVAAAAGMSRQALGQAELGRGEVNAGDIPFLCQTLDVPVTYLFAGLEVSLEPPLPDAGDADPATQRALLGRFNALSQRDRTVVLTIATMLAGGEVASHYQQLIAFGDVENEKKRTGL